MLLHLQNFWTISCGCFLDCLQRYSLDDKVNDEGKVKEGIGEKETETMNGLSSNDDSRGRQDISQESKLK